MSRLGDHKVLAKSDYLHRTSLALIFRNGLVHLVMQLVNF